MSEQQFELQPSPPDPQQVRVYSLDDCEWWAGYSLESCIAAARDQAGAECYEYAEQYGRELSDSEMQEMAFVDENEDGSIDCATTRTFAAELQRRSDAGEQFPQFFACTEY